MAALVSTDPVSRPFITHNWDNAHLPLVISVPHAGRVYPREIRDNLAVSERHLLRLEDRYVDRLARRAIDAGFPTIVATQARAVLDLNRAVDEIEAHMVPDWPDGQARRLTRKVKAGLGIIPGRLAGQGMLWKRAWGWPTVSRRIETIHRPYHAEISAKMDDLKSRFGSVILLDLHSMPSIVADGDGAAPKVVLGDRFGKSMASRYADLARMIAGEYGISVATNHPYAGGYILARHGRPALRRHALQIEIDRGLYLDEFHREFRNDNSDMGGMIVAMAEGLASEITGHGVLLAAE